MLEHAIVESKRQVKRLAQIETDAQHLAAFEQHLLKRGIIRFDKTEVAG